MKNFKFTGANISAALLVIAFFFPWVSAMGTMSLSGFSITTTGISPGMLSMLVSGVSRLLMILVVLIPISGALILYQNITGNTNFSKYYKPAHIIPAVLLIVGLVMIYFKMKPDMPEQVDEYSMRQLSRMQNMSPGLFDILGIGVYISLAAAIYLVLVNTGKVKDKEYYKPQPTAVVPIDNKTDSNSNS